MGDVPLMEGFKVSRWKVTWCLVIISLLVVTSWCIVFPLSWVMVTSKGWRISFNTWRVLDFEPLSWARKLIALKKSSGWPCGKVSLHVYVFDLTSWTIPLVRKRMTKRLHDVDGELKRKTDNYPWGRRVADCSWGRYFLILNLLKSQLSRLERLLLCGLNPNELLEKVVVDG